MSPVSTPSSGHGTRRGYPLPEDGLWLFVLGDLLVYGLLFLVCAHAASGDVEGFRAGQALLSKPVAFVNTLVLLTGSWLVALATTSFRRQRPREAGRYVQAAIACALIFVCLKLGEYGVQIHRGWYLTSSDFLMYYYVLTGIHLLHVLAGLLVLWLMLRLTRRGESSHDALQSFAGGAVFWHLIDLLWLVLFPLLYLVA